MSGKIDAYIDVVSPYSWFAFKYLRDNRELLRSHGVEVEFHPFFLGGVNVATGNTPPWKVPAKATYGEFDRKRACAYFGIPYHSAPKFFPILSILPLRALLAIKNSPSPQIRATLEPAYQALYVALWTPRALDVSIPANLRTVLSEVFAEAGLGDAETNEIMKMSGSEEAKGWLKANTEKVVAMGGFGSPWCWVLNENGVEEGFFGSDRFHYMWEFLKLPARHLELTPKVEGKRKAKI